MRKYWIAPLIVVLMAGCASASTPSYLLSENQEEWIQKTLIGTWNGWIKDTRNARIVNNDVTLKIYKVRKEQDGWTANALVNWQSPEYTKLNVYNGTVTLEIMDRYGGLFTLELYQNTHFLGKVGYERGAWNLNVRNDIVLKKISR